MEADVVAVLEGFPERIAGIEAQHGRIFGVDALVRGTGRMRCSARIGEGLRQAAVVRVIAAEIQFLILGSGMHHEAEVDVVEIAAVHEFRLAADEVDDAFLTEFLAERQLDHFLRRNHHETDLSGKAVKRVFARKTRRDAEHGRTLCAMPAGMVLSVHRAGMIGNV